MNKNYLDIKTIIIVLLLIVILFLRWCTPKPDCPEVGKTTIVETIKYDTIKDEIPQYIPVPGPAIHDTTFIPREIDTAAILKDYFALYAYADSVKLDSVTLVIKDTVSRNKIKSRSVEYEILYPTKTITITNDRYLNRREFYVGPAISGATDGFKFVGIESIYRSKKNTTFKVNAGINENFGVQLGLGMHWRLKFKQ